MSAFTGILTVLGFIASILTLFNSLMATSAMQQIAGTAFAVAFVVIPYCLHRVVEGWE